MMGDQKAEWMDAKVFNDCVHGHMSFPKLLVSIIDTPEFYRLRNIKQCGFVDHVYPAAGHHRFEHSLGTCHVAGKLLESLERNGLVNISEKQKWCVKIAALCHDLGHGPYSHTWELFLKRENIKFEHEDASVAIVKRILKHKKVAEEFERHHLGENDIELIANLIKGHSSRALPKDRYLYQIVSNKDYDVDVDKWDYLSRDNLLLNQTAAFDYQRLLEYCQVARVEEKERFELCFRDKEVRNILDMFVMRATLHDKAYQHRVVKIIELMFVDALIAANRDDPDLKLTSTDIDDLLELTDHVYYIIRNNSKTKASKEILMRLESRHLYSLVHTFNFDHQGIELSTEVTEDVLKTIEDKLHKISSNNNDGPSRADIAVLPVTVTLGSKMAEGGLRRIYTYSKGDPNVIKLLNRVDHLFESCVTRDMVKFELLVINKGSDTINATAEEMDEVIGSVLREITKKTGNKEV